MEKLICCFYLEQFLQFFLFHFNPITMNRFVLTALLWPLALYTSQGQTASSIFNQVIGSTGHSAVQQGSMYTYTLGEVSIATLSSTNRILTQGFHQPEHTQIVSIGTPELINWDIQLFPNPVSEMLTIRFSAEKGSALRATVVDLVGKVILHEQLLSEPNGSRIDCSAWHPGIYFLILKDPTSRAQATSRIIRL